MSYDLSSKSRETALAGLRTEPAPLLDGRSVPPVLTVREVTHELRCSKAHVHNIINGKVRGVSPLPSLWLGRRRLVLRASFEKWLKANEHPLGSML